MVTSHASNPAIWKLATISLSPLLPSSLIMATLGWLSLSGDDGTGSNDSLYSGARLLQRPASSSITHCGLFCSRSSWKLVASQISRKSTILCSNTTSPPTRTDTTASSPNPAAFPIKRQGTSFERKAFMMISVSSSFTSKTIPNSSANRTSATLFTVAVKFSGHGTSMDRPQLPAKAISTRVVTSPPSLTSWPETIRLWDISSCVVLNAASNIWKQ